MNIQGWILMIQMVAGGGMHTADSPYIFSVLGDCEAAGRRQHAIAYECRFGYAATAPNGTAIIEFTPQYEPKR